MTVVSQIDKTKKNYREKKYMIKYQWVIALACFTILSSDIHAKENIAMSLTRSSPLEIGETFSIESKLLNESRIINVYLPPVYKEHPDIKLPVLYMPDGGIDEDFLHIAGLMQVSIMNGTMRPFILVGIENTERRRDLTGPTDFEEDKKVAPRVGGSEAFRTFLKSELMPAIQARYQISNERAIIGESYAGLFVLETFLLEPELFDTYIAIDPSVWWNGGELVKSAEAHLRKMPGLKKTLFFASSNLDWITKPSIKLVGNFEKCAPEGVHWVYQPMPEETHGTIYHPTAMKAFKKLFKPIEIR